MAWTQTDLDRINAALASGELTVEYDGRRTTYRSLSDLLAMRRLIQSELNPSLKTDGQIVFATNKGFGGSEGESAS